MRVIVDTCIWSLALRRHVKHLSANEAILRQELEILVDEGRAQLIGPIRQEVLSGIRDASQFNRLSTHLRAFSDEPLTTPDDELAAKMSNQCRGAGITGSPVDFLICAIATARNWPIFTYDADFKVFGRILPIRFFASQA